ncbi:hypothetical protein PAPYR_1908 [Paratrimastix pyriformis]|uniref:Uncharacterized protein n=1 Tax=Paratrimastix pyriformis TaxID=342808 RepID=A0ABQ8UTB5_9EUKA|nr:hypothetical protein PAPYR_1908 [Paratrimastix pyriformis]
MMAFAECLRPCGANVAEDEPESKEGQNPEWPLFETAEASEQSPTRSVDNPEVQALHTFLDLHRKGSALLGLLTELSDPLSLDPNSPARLAVDVERLEATYREFHSLFAKMADALMEMRRDWHESKAAPEIGECSILLQQLEDEMEVVEAIGDSFRYDGSHQEHTAMQIAWDTMGYVDSALLGRLTGAMVAPLNQTVSPPAPLPPTPPDAVAR